MKPEHVKALLAKDFFEPWFMDLLREDTEFGAVFLVAWLQIIGAF
jgi:hypothetical protein